MLSGAIAIIPTRMGTRGGTADKACRNRDHPHAYGDKLTSSFLDWLKMGSSPRVWGQVIYCCKYNVNPRIIPTRMGTSQRAVCRRIYAEDHPHAYGDKSGEIYNVVFKKGSSPRVWGQDITDKICVKNAGIIPTRMGTSVRIALPHAEGEDHPHAYGDKDYRWYSERIY